MSRFKMSQRPAPPRDIVRMSQPSPGVVPMPAGEFVRRRRRKVVLWAAAGAAVAVLATFSLYWLSQPMVAEDSYLDAKRLFESGKHAYALEAVDRAVRGRGQRAEAYRLRASILQALNRPREAIVDISRVIAIEPTAAANYYTRALMYLDTGDVRKALEDYTLLIGMENSAAALTGRGLCYERMNLPAKAAADFTKVIEHSPSVESYLQRGLVRNAMGDARGAIEDLDQAIELGPRVSAAYRARASAREQLGDQTGARSDRDKALSIEKPPPLKLEQVELPRPD